MARLVYVENGARREFALEPDRTSWMIGRNPVCDLCINSPSMSRRHAEVRLDASTGRFTVHDNRSANGTFVNGKRAEGTPLSDGDEILLAEFKVRFVEPPRRRTDGLSPAGGVPSVPADSGRVEVPKASATLAGGRVAVAPSDPMISTIDEDVDVLEMDDLVEDAAESPAAAPQRPMTEPTAGRPAADAAPAEEDRVSTPFDIEPEPEFEPNSATVAPFVTSPSSPAPAAPAPAPAASSDGGASSAALELARRERDRYQDQVRTLTEEVTALRAELDAAPKANDLEKSAARVAELETEIEHLNERIRAVGTRLREADAALDDRQAHLEEVKAELAEARSNAAGAGDEATGLRDQISALTTERDALKADLAARDEAATAAAARIEELEAALATANEAAASASTSAGSAQGRIEELESELADARAENEDLAGQLSEAADPDVIDMQARRIVDLATALETARAERDEAFAARDEATAAHEAASTESAERGEQLATLQRQADDRAADLERVTSTLEVRDRELEGERATAAAATATADEIRNRFAALEETAQRDSADLDAARTAVATLEERVAKLEAALAASAVARDNIATLVTAMRDSLTTVQGLGDELATAAASLADGGDGDSTAADDAGDVESGAEAPA